MCVHWCVRKVWQTVGVGLLSPAWLVFIIDFTNTVTCLTTGYNDKYISGCISVGFRFAFSYIVRIGIVVVCVCVFPNLCALMQVRSTEVGSNSGCWICADDPTRRRFFYMTCVFCCFCFAFAVPASGELQKNIRGPESGVGPTNLNNVRVNGICTFHQVSALFLQTHKQNETSLHLLRVLQGRQGFCTLDNLFRQAEHCYRFSDSPPFSFP